MTKREKLLRRIKQNPRNVAFRDLRTLLELFGFEIKRTRGSHYSFGRTISGREVLLVVPFKHPLKAVYVRQALALIVEIEASERGDVDDRPASKKP